MDTFNLYQNAITDPKKLDELNVLDENNDYQFLTKKEAKISQLRFKKSILRIKIEQINDTIALLDTSKNTKKSNSKNDKAKKH